jgi:hypothetical protein
VRYLVMMSSALLGLGCPGPPPVVDAGRPAPDAGPERIVDGGTLGPLQLGSIDLVQRARTTGQTVRFTSSVQATFLEVAAGTPNPCVERIDGRCTVRVCNAGGAVVGTPRRAGVLTLEGALVVDRPDGGPDAGADAGSDGGADAGGLNTDGGVLTLGPGEGGTAVVTVPARLFTAGQTLVVRATGDEVPAFASPPLEAPSQLIVTSPVCDSPCTVTRALPVRVSWRNAPAGDVSIELVGRQVSARCTASGREERFDLEPSVLEEFPPSVELGDTSLVISGVSASSFDAGGFRVTVRASTPTLVPLVLE